MAGICDVSGCGTGGWDGPKPGDPDMTNILLTAVGTYGGIELNWTWPGLNPGAVSHTIVWRSLQPNFETANKQTIVQGNYYFDRVDTNINQNTRYYYWVQMVSIYDTLGDVIGPATAVATPLIGQMIEILTGQIDAGVLAGTLRTEIEQIRLNKLGITQEEIIRAQNDDGLAVRISQLDAKTDQAMAILQEEVRVRTDADGALVEVVNTMYSDFNGNVAAVQNEVRTLATKTDALASTVTTVNAQVNGNSASGQVGLVAQVNTINGKVTDIGARWTAVVDVNGLVGGFGVYNNGQTVEAGFNVDRFWIGRTNANRRKPFIVENNVVYIDDAAIRQLTFEKLRAQDGSLIVQNGKIQANFIAVDQITVNNIRSNNYVPNSTGWALASDGDFQLNGVSGGGRMSLTPTLLRIYDANGVMRVRLGVW